MHLTAVRPHRGVVRTPLRYPGGKTRLTGFLAKVIQEGGWAGCTYVEPYAGGAGAALSLLHDSVVGHIVINDLDRCIASFWAAAVNDSEAFLERFDAPQVTLETWHEQREIYRHPDSASTLELGFATFFLNRTNRSGIMNAGVIGGQKQDGTYKSGARYNQADLRGKLAWLGQHSHAITVSNDDGLTLLREYLPRTDVVAYVDPPYFDKGSYLYMNSFTESAHADLAELLKEQCKTRWVLTYDDVPEIRELYRGLYQGTFTLPYSAHTASNARERMVLSDPVAELKGIMPGR